MRKAYAQCPGNGVEVKDKMYMVIVYSYMSG